MPQLRGALLRPSEAADRMPEMRIHLRAGGALQAAPPAAARTGGGPAGARGGRGRARRPKRSRRKRSRKRPKLRPRRRPGPRRRRPRTTTMSDDDDDEGEDTEEDFEEAGMSVVDADDEDDLRHRRRGRGRRRGRCGPARRRRRGRRRQRHHRRRHRKGRVVRPRAFDMSFLPASQGRKNWNGAVAQLGERVNGIHEVSGSIPLSSTSFRSRCMGAPVSDPVRAIAAPLLDKLSSRPAIFRCSPARLAQGWHRGNGSP